jgi:hypothetical protein
MHCLFALDSAMRRSRRALGLTGCCLEAPIQSTPALWKRPARNSGSNISAAFTVRFSFTQFQLRMRVSKQARIEFIARGTFSPMNCVWIAGCIEYPTCFFILFVHAQGDCGTSGFPSQSQILDRPLVQTVLGSGLSRSVLRSLAHPRGWMPASASSIGLPHQVHHRPWILHP